MASRHDVIPSVVDGNSPGPPQPRSHRLARSATRSGIAQQEPAVAEVRDDEAVTVDDMKEQDDREHCERLHIGNHATVVQCATKTEHLNAKLNRSPLHETKQRLTSRRNCSCRHICKKNIDGSFHVLAHKTLGRRACWSAVMQQ